MNGVTILSQTTEIIETKPEWAFCFSFYNWVKIAGLGLLFIAFCRCLYKRFKDDDQIWEVLLVAICIISFLLGSSIFTHGIKKEQIQYKVICDDTVTLNDFFNHYELFGQEGSIYIVAEKEVED